MRNSVWQCYIAWRKVNSVTCNVTYRQRTVTYILLHTATHHVSLRKASSKTMQYIVQNITRPCHTLCLIYSNREALSSTLQDELTCWAPHRGTSLLSAIHWDLLQHNAWHIAWNCETLCDTLWWAERHTERFTICRNAWQTVGLSANTSRKVWYWMWHLMWHIHEKERTQENNNIIQYKATMMFRIE